MIVTSMVRLGVFFNVHHLIWQLLLYIESTQMLHNTEQSSLSFFKGHNLLLVFLITDGKMWIRILKYMYFITQTFNCLNVAIMSSDVM